MWKGCQSNNVDLMIKVSGKKNATRKRPKNREISRFFRKEAVFHGFFGSACGLGRLSSRFAHAEATRNGGKPCRNRSACRAGDKTRVMAIASSVKPVFLSTQAAASPARQSIVHISSQPV